MAAPNPTLSAWKQKLGHRAVKAEAAKLERDSASLYGPTPGRFTVFGSKRPPALSNRIELGPRPPCSWISNPAVDVGLMPAAPVDADPDLRWERALGDLAVDGGPGQPGPGKNGFQADDTFWFSHCCTGSCWLFLTTSETRQGGPLQARKSILPFILLGRSDGGKQDSSNSEVPASAEVDAVREGEFEAKTAARFERDAKLPLAIVEEGFQLRIAF